MSKCQPPYLTTCDARTDGRTHTELSQKTAERNRTMDHALLLPSVALSLAPSRNLSRSRSLSLSAERQEAALRLGVRGVGWGVKTRGQRLASKDPRRRSVNSLAKRTCPAFFCCYTCPPPSMCPPLHSQCLSACTRAVLCFLRGQLLTDPGGEVREEVLLCPFRVHGIQQLRKPLCVCVCVCVFVQILSSSETPGEDTPKKQRRNLAHAHRHTDMHTPTS